MISVKDVSRGIYQIHDIHGKEFAYLFYNSKFDINYEEVGETDKHYDFTLFVHPANGGLIQKVLRIQAYKFLSKKFDRRYTYHIDIEPGYTKIRGLI